MKFTYVIVSRQPGETKGGEYKGQLEAQTSGEALIKALAQEFGDPGKPPREAISSWLGDEEGLLCQLDGVEGDDSSFQLDTIDTVFDIEVELVP